MNSTAHTQEEVQLEKVATRMGDRLEVRSTRSGESVRIDALALEALSWQEFDEVLPSENSVSQSSDHRISAYSNGEEVSLPHEMQFRNEYALADVTVKNDEVKVASPKIGFYIPLPYEMLEWLSNQNSDIFSEFLENPFGPHV
jgi:hypothetical protein